MHARSASTSSNESSLSRDFHVIYECLLRYVFPMFQPFFFKILKSKNTIMFIKEKDGMGLKDLRKVNNILDLKVIKVPLSPLNTQKNELGQYFATCGTMYIFVLLIFV